MFEGSRRVALVVALVFVNNVRTEILTPPYFNLAEGRRITASATCGEDIEGPELYCKLVGTNSANYSYNELHENVIHGQSCDYCDPTRPDRMHPPEFAVDGMETWWQSPPLSRGMKYNEVNLTIDFGQEFHVAYVFIRMGNSPRPGLWILEKSTDYGETYVPWQYFTDLETDCETYFGVRGLQPITRDDSVICTTEYSKIVPLEGGEIPISLLNNRPSANHYFNSSVLQEWTRATNVRFRFLRTKNLLGHLMSVARQDPTVTRRYFYSIKDISIGGRCMCNGHADSCDIQDPTNTSLLLCRCQHNTCGAKCETCCRGFQQKAWRQSKSYSPFVCEPCNCFEHSYECSYDAEVDRQRLSLDIHGNYEGGGVCQNCQHNTEGINCNKCKSTYYRPFNKFWNETDVCHPCECNYFYSTGNCEEGTGRCECRKEFTPPNCDSCSFGYYNYPNCKPCECYLNGTQSLQCEPRDGQCFCEYNYGGKYCKECAEQYYNFPECKPCECNTLGSISSTCDQHSGNCTCKSNYGGKQCDQCQHGYYSYPSCTYCNCDVTGTQPGICNKDNGKCLCKEGYGGERCDQCVPGYYGHPECIPCNCSLIGSASPACDTTGKCRCLDNFGGRTCEKCSVGYYKYPECLSCNCDGHGAIGISCNSEGRCQCQYNFDGNSCNQCREGFYNFPSCEECNCNPAGVVAAFAGCGSVPAGKLCQCKERVQGRICDQCRPSFWNLHLNNPEGCDECRCHIPGVLGGNAVCNSESGQCVCKPSVVARSCSECVDGTYDLQADSLYGCRDCGCDIGGSISPVCDKLSGQCPCQSRVTGRTCKQPLQAHYFPTLYQYQYEVEDGHTPAHTAVRYAYDENVFPGYSWKGYAVFSTLQNEILQDVYIYKPSLYRMVIRYVNLNAETVTATIKVTPENPSDNEQTIKVYFKYSSQPAFETISSAGNALVINPGRWTVSIQAKQSLFVDYFVLLPEDFYLATILNQKIEEPCIIGQNKLCRDYSYPNTSMFDMSWGSGGFVFYGKNINSLTEYYDNTEHLNELQITNRIPLLNVLQPEISYNVTVSKPGRYVIVINYITPINDQRTHTLNVDTVAQNGKSSGIVTFYACPYRAVCRQAVTDKQSGVGVHLVDGNSISVTIQSVKANLGIHSIVAIPIEEWSLEYIKPKPVCIRKNGTCVSSSYPTPPESKKVQFEQEADIKGGVKHTVYRFSNTTSYVYITPDEEMVDLHAKVWSPGTYVFIVQYFQPNFPEFDLEVILQNGEFYEATLPVPHCPSQSGCRALVTEHGGNTKFTLTENFMISLKLPKEKSIYLDYLLIVPADLYTSTILEEDTLDRSGEFISTCGSNHFNINTAQEGFCRDSVFSITASHNNGALPCQCDYDGSLSFECDRFGGQCPCKPNIIGRQCEACKTGYYGFPDCKPCNCPSTALCETSTGRCICPTRVTGERCDQCMPYTYGYDPIIGCEECKCNPLGDNNNLQCDLLNGSCTCKKNIVGRTCDTCQAGYFAFPYCEICECDLRGTIDEICDQQSAECLCKKDVTGPACNLCREGSFNLQRNNEEGCTECFCFGKTTRCTSSNLAQTFLLIMNDWKLVAINETYKLDIIPLNITLAEVARNSIGADFTAEDLKDKHVYFSAPRQYLGSKLTSYGGFLNYTIFYTIALSGKAVSGADVILEGAGMYLMHTSVEQPAAVMDYSASLQLVESNFHFLSGIPAKREHIMVVLHDLRGIYLRANYWSASITTKLSNVAMDDAVPPHYINADPRTLRQAVSVEQCQCPPGYNGLSCEFCAPGYFRISSGPHGGYCVPCQCNGHADECDVNTGLCIDCKHNTRGEHCDQCEIGYHGNALHGTPKDCLICACPLPVASNNFANGCEVSSDGEKISCDCIQGYFGARCQSCAAGYFGSPEVLGEHCKPCLCSGNINPREPGSCDTVTGECLRCLNNTFGETCALCRPGYYGDAIQAKNCQPCICDQVGTKRCNSYTGQCECKPNVIGDKCDRCELEHYGFQSGQGCIPCNCDTASLSAQCDDVTGQCRCKPGVTGRACDRCAAGYWNYKDEGCDSCGCKSEYSLGFGCNADTGHCECLPGVVGEKCDQCPHRWAFIADIGCHQCDKCVHNLLDDTDVLHNMIGPHLLEFDSVDSGYFTTQRLAHINQTVKELKPRVKLLDPSVIDLTPIIQELEGLEQDSENMNRKANYSTDNSKDLANEGDDIREEALTVLDAIREAAEHAREAINNVEFLSDSLISGEGPRIDAALQEAQHILEQIKIYDLTAREAGASKQLTKAIELLASLHDFKRPVDDVDAQIGGYKKELQIINDKIDDLYNHTQYSLNKAVEADSYHAKSGKERVVKKLESIEQQKQEVEKNLKDSEQLLINATRYLKDAQKAYTDIADDPQILERANNNLNETLEHNFKELTIIEEKVPEVEEHANQLIEQAQELDNLLSESRNISENAVRAAQAYKNIVDAVDLAHAAAIDGTEAATNASELLLEVAEDTITSSDISAELLLEARNANDTTIEARLEAAQKRSRPVRSLHGINEERLLAIENFLKNPQRSYDDKLINAGEIATNAKDLSQDTIETTFIHYQELPAEKEASISLPNKLDNAKRNITNAQKKIQMVNEHLPMIIGVVNDLPAKQAKVRHLATSLDDKIKILKQQIALARDVANRIKVGVQFYRNTTLELRNPPNLDDLSTSTQISGYFKTKEANGLILYLGNGKGTNLRRTTSDDYMALEVENGYLVLTVDVGNGPQRVVNNKYVADDTWYQFIIDRTAHHAKLTVREEISGGRDKLHTSDEELQGYNTIFNLDKNQSKLFVGGYPPQFPIQNQVRQNSFDGEIEDLVIGEIPISLWNFNDGNDNNHGAIRRDKLVNLQPSTGFRFNGNGYTIIDARSFSLRQRSDIQLGFKTFAPNGLLFLVQSNTSKTFISLEIQDGRVVYQYNLGHDTKKWSTTKQYNDGKWHTIDATRDGAKGRFIVDGEDIRDQSYAISGHNVEFFDKFFFGGYPQYHSLLDVSNVDFDGCIDNVTIMGNPVDLSQNVQAYGVTPGCPEKFARLVSFEQNGYVGSDNFSSNDLFQMNLKFKTKTKEGLILFATDKFKNEGVSLSLVGGRLILISQKIQLETDDYGYNDNEWHVVSITHNTTTLRLDVDDYIHKVTDSPPAPMRVMYGDIFFGGVPQNYDVKRGMVATTMGFSGCIIDASRNGVIVNFASYGNKKGEILGKCILDELIGSETSVHKVPSLTPIDELGYGTTKSPETRTREPVEAGIPIRGDGGRENGNPLTETTTVAVPGNTEKIPVTEKPAPITERIPVTEKIPVTSPPIVRPGVKPGYPPITKPPSTSEPSCVLPMIPAVDITAPTRSYKYGMERPSRSEYTVSRGKYRKQYDFTLEFKTMATEGILFYVTNPNETEYVGLFMQDGYIVYSFNGGVGPATMVSKEAYNDGNWHHVNISRSGSDGKLIIDDKVVAEARTPKNTSTIVLYPPYYIGGVPIEKFQHVFANLNTTSGFDGCISNFHMNGYVMDEPTNIGVVGCVPDVEPGVFFGVQGGYMKLKDKFRVGLEIDIKMEIKPRNISGLLVSVHGKKDYLVLEMVNGVIKLTVENGKGAISTSFQPDKPHYFCDGQWHNIQAVKSKNVVTLSVDSTFTDPGVGDYRSQSTDTGGALFLGGHRLIHRARGLSTRSSFVGCIKDVQINNNPIKFVQEMAEGHITVGSCPTV